MQMISAGDTIDALSISEAAEIIADTYARLASGEVTPSSPSAMRIAGPPHRIQVKGAVLHHKGIAGARLSSLSDPRLILWDLNTGAPIVLMEEKWLYTFRTGISGAVVARWLSPCPQPRIALIGAGKIATQMARGFAQLCSPTSIRVASRSQESAEKLVSAVATDGLDIKATLNIEDMVREADIVATITTATSPIVKSSWMKPGALALSMGGAQEFEPDIWHTANHRFVDDIDYALYQGDLSALVKSGTATRDEVQSAIVSIGEVANGRWPGRSGPFEGVYAVIQGLTALDLALADRIAAAYSEKQPRAASRQS